MLKLADSDVACENQMSLGMGLQTTLFQVEGVERDFQEADPGNEEVAND